MAEEQRVKRSQEMRPRDVGPLERAMLYMSDERVFERLLDPRRGWFVRVGLPTAGAALAAGPAWRHSNSSRTYTFTASAAGSVSREWIGEVALQVPDLLPLRADDLVFAGLSLARSGRVENEFWGLGNDSVSHRRRTFRLSQTDASGLVGVRLAPWLKAAATTSWLTPYVRASRRQSPSMVDTFDELTAPGLSRQPAFFRTMVSLDLDYRDSTPPTRTAVRLDQLPVAAAARGGRYLVTWASYRDRELHRYSFHQTTIDLQQHVSFLHGERGVAVRALAVLSDADRGHAVPFYLMPTLGGLSVGRSYPTFRFRDQQLLALQAEYRYRINPLMNGALFVDSGQVASRVGQFSWVGFRPSYGAGVRLGAGGAAALRLDVALGGGNIRIILAGGHAF